MMLMMSVREDLGWKAGQQRGAMMLLSYCLMVG